MPFDDRWFTVALSTAMEVTKWARGFSTPLMPQSRWLCWRKRPKENRRLHLGRAHLELDEISLVPELFQPRDMSEKHIGDLARIIETSGAVDAVTVFQLPERVVLVDGHHRHEAYRRARKAPEVIPVVYFKGSLKEAVLAAGEGQLQNQAAHDVERTTGLRVAAGAAGEVQQGGNPRRFRGLSV